MASFVLQTTVTLWSCLQKLFDSSFKSGNKNLNTCRLQHIKQCFTCLIKTHGNILTV